MRRLDTADADFEQALAQLRRAPAGDDGDVETVVAAIIADVAARGDAALLEYTARFDKLSAPDVAALEIPAARRRAALQAIDPAQREALEFAAARVREYHAPTTK